MALPDPSESLADALLAAVPDAALVCDADGTIRRANGAAARLLDTPDLVGQSVFEWLDRAVVRAAGPEPFAADVGGQPVDVYPAPTEEGFVLVLRPPAAPALRRDVDRLALDLAESVRGPLASIRAAIETLTEYPEMDEVVAAQFTMIIREQAVALSVQLEDAAASLAEATQADRPLEPLPAAEFLDRVRAVCHEVGLATDVAEPPSLIIRTAWDGLRPGLVHLATRIAHATRTETLDVQLGQTGQLASLDLGWAGAAIGADRLQRWLHEALGTGESLDDVLERHGGACWVREVEAGRGAVRLLLPSMAVEAGTAGPGL